MGGNNHCHPIRRLTASRFRTLKAREEYIPVGWLSKWEGSWLVARWKEVMGSGCPEIG